MARERHHDGLEPLPELSVTERQILQLAADVMGVPLSQLMSIRSSVPLTQAASAPVPSEPTSTEPVAHSDVIPEVSISPPNALQPAQLLPLEASTLVNPSITPSGLVGLYDHGWSYQSDSAPLGETFSKESSHSQLDYPRPNRPHSSDFSTSSEVIITPDTGDSPSGADRRVQTSASTTAFEPTTVSETEPLLGTSQFDIEIAENASLNATLNSNLLDDLSNHFDGQAFDTSHADFTQQQTIGSWNTNPGTDRESFLPSSTSDWSFSNSNAYGIGPYSSWVNIDPLVDVGHSGLYNEDLPFSSSHVLDPLSQPPVVGPGPPRSSLGSTSWNLNQLSSSAPPGNWGCNSNSFMTSEDDIFLKLMNQHYGLPGENNVNLNSSMAAPMVQLGMMDMNSRGDALLTSIKPPHENKRYTIEQAGVSQEVMGTGSHVPRGARQGEPVHTTVLGPSRVQRTTFRKPKQRGAFSQQERQETARARGLNACLRCRTQRLRCITNDNDPAGTCQTCARITGPVITRIPCLRYKIMDTQFAVQKQSPEQYWSKRWPSMKLEEIDNWADQSTRFITLTQDVGSARDFLRVRRIVPQAGDSLQRTWLSRSSGERQFHPCAAYAIDNLHDAAIDMREAFRKDILEYIEYYIDHEDRLLRSTYEMAHNHSQVAKTQRERSLLQNVLLLWVAVRYDSKPSRICGADTLDMAPQTIDSERHDYGHFPVPPVISAQLSLLTTAALINPLHKDIRRDLTWLFESKQRRKESWFTIYLTTFLLLHNYALITKYYEKKARNLRLHTKYAAMAVLESLHGGANILLAHFHYCTPGSLPFAKGWHSEVDVANCGVEEDQIEFLKQTSAELKAKASAMDEIKGGFHFENDYYFLAQLFDLAWQPAVRTVNG
ncbi:hypothetical protein DL98DRAFT_591519 [Cadophora sp. DSE1049]|nr:hypothetical protein DL98DRAFT_591519 [Cadophora sp. DSE1049]